jgi:hypothetical protein
MQWYDTRLLEIPDRFANRLQHQFFVLAASHPRSRVLMKNISMLIENTEYLLPDELTNQVPEARLRSRLVRHREDEVKHYRLWREHLESRGELLEDLPQRWKLPFSDFVDAGWIPSPEKIKEARVERVDMIKLFAMARVLEARASLALAYFAEGCRGLDDSICPLVEEILRDENWHLAYSTEEMRRLAGEDLADYAEYLANKAWEVHTRWQMRSMNLLLQCFLDDPDFAGGGVKRRFWLKFQKVCERQGAMANPEDLRPLSLSEFRAANSLEFKLDRKIRGLAGRLWGTEARQQPRPEGEVEVTLRFDAPAEKVFSAATEIDRWHLWHSNSWNASLRERGALRPGCSILVRLKKGGELIEKIKVLDPATRRAEVECHNAPFPLASYTATLEVHDLGSHSELTYRMRYQPQGGMLSGMLDRMGLARALEKTLRDDFTRFKDLLQNTASTGPLFAANKSVTAAASA